MPGPRRRAQSGLALIIVLILVAAAAGVGLAGLHSAQLQNQLAGRALAQASAFHSAESALTRAERALKARPLGADHPLLRAIRGETVRYCLAAEQRGQPLASCDRFAADDANSAWVTAQSRTLWPGAPRRTPQAMGTATLPLRLEITGEARVGPEDRPFGRAQHRRTLRVHFANGRRQGVFQFPPSQGANP